MRCSPACWTQIVLKKPVPATWPPWPETGQMFSRRPRTRQLNPHQQTRGRTALLRAAHAMFAAETWAKPPRLRQPVACSAAKIRANVAKAAKAKVARGKTICPLSHCRSRGATPRPRSQGGQGAPGEATCCGRFSARRMPCRPALPPPSFPAQRLPRLLGQQRLPNASSWPKPRPSPRQRLGPGRPARN